MMLVHKQLPSHFSLPSPYHHHRRHPSAPPAVVVQPTRTPGLLSLSKPPKSSPQRQHPGPRPLTKSTPKSKPSAAAPNRSPQPAAAVVPKPVVLKPSPQISEKSAVAPSPEKSQSRGRQQAKPAKDKTTATRHRSASHSSPNRGRRNNTRQPSPPTQSSQAEGPITPTFPRKPTNASNLFDPFLDDSPVPNSAPRSTKPVRAAPTLSARPSGKLARRRQPIPPFPTTPTKSTPVPVPEPRQTPTTMLSRSDPAPSHMPPRPFNAAVWDAFPICDDMTDAGDLDQDIFTPPVTPTRPRSTRATRNMYDDGPRTAPLSTAGFGFPFAHNTTPSPTPAPRSSTAQGKSRPNHKRNPSEGVFHMSSDEESSQGPSSQGLKMLFGLMPSGRAGSAPASSGRGGSSPARNTASPSAARRAEKEAEREAAERAAGYFASSMFQNSPNPEELPPPLFA